MRLRMVSQLAAVARDYMEPLVACLLSVLLL